MPAMKRIAPVLVLALAACGGKSTGAHGPATASVTATIEPLERTVQDADQPEWGDIHVRMPKVTVPGNPAATAAINAALGTPADASGLDAGGEVGLDYTVHHNGDGLLSLSISHETMGAYPDGYVDDFLFDLTTGARLTPTQLFRADGLDGLAAALDAKLQPKIAAARAEGGDCADVGDDLFDRTFTAADIADVTVGDGKIDFGFPFDFPHVALACEPDGVVPMSLDELAPFLAADSPLHRLHH